MKTLKALALATIPIVGAFLCLLLFQISAAVQSFSQDERALAQSAANMITEADSAVQSGSDAAQAAAHTLVSADAVLQTVNRPCGGGKPCGTLADVAKTLNTVRGTFGQIEIAANHEDHNLTTLDAQEAQLFADTHSTLLAANSTLGSANAFIASPDLSSSLHYLSVSSVSLADSAKQTDAILTDARIEADKFVHPPKKKLGFWGATEAAGDWIRHFMPPIF